MRVRVLQAGVYNGPDHHDPIRAQPGDVIEVAGGWYAAELIERGLVAPPPDSDSATGGEGEVAAAAENQAAVGAQQKKPFEPRSKKLSDIRRLSDLKEA